MRGGDSGKAGEGMEIVCILLMIVVTLERTRVKSHQHVRLKIGVFYSKLHFKAD